MGGESCRSGLPNRAGYAALRSLMVSGRRRHCLFNLGVRSDGVCVCYTEKETVKRYVPASFFYLHARARLQPCD